MKEPESKMKKESKEEPKKLAILHLANEDLTESGLSKMEEFVVLCNTDKVVPEPRKGSYCVWGYACVRIWKVGSCDRKTNG